MRALGKVLMPFDNYYHTTNKSGRENGPREADGLLAKKVKMPERIAQFFYKDLLLFLLIIFFYYIKKRQFTIFFCQFHLIYKNEILNFIVHKNICLKLDRNIDYRKRIQISCFNVL